MSVLGYVVVDRPPGGSDWWVEHSGAPWQTVKDAQAELESCQVDSDQVASMTDEIASQLKAARLARGMTLADVAEVLGVTEGYICHLEKGRRRGGLDLWVAYAEAVGMRLTLVASPLGAVDD